MKNKKISFFIPVISHFNVLGINAGTFENV